MAIEFPAMIPARAALLLGMCLAACETTGPPPLVDPPAGRESVQTIALVVEAPVPPPEVQRPVTGPFEGFLYGTGQGLLTGVEVSTQLGRGMSGGGEIAVILWMALTATTITVCTVGGALIGPFQAMPRAEARRRVRAIEGVFVETQLMPTLEVALRSAVRAARPDVRIVWTDSPADATLHVRISGYGLLGHGGFDPDVAVAVLAETWWFANGEEHRADFLHLGPSHGLVHWSDHAGELRQELRRACERLATRIAEERLLVEVVR